MLSVEWTARLVERYEHRIQRRISFAGLSRLLNRGKTFVFQIVRHDRGPRIGDMLESQQRAGDEHPPDLFHEAFEQPGGDPLVILACNRRHQGLEPSSLLVNVAPRILALVDSGVEACRPWRSRRERIRREERLRVRDLRLAQQRLERLVQLGLSLIERSVGRSPAALGDLALCLASLAVVYRTAGRLDDALDALLLAHPLSTLSDDPLVQGIWYRKAAYLLVYLGRCDRAYEWIEEAGIHFIEASSASQQAKTLVDRGFVLSHAGRSDAACQKLKRALNVLPIEERAYQFAAHQILAYEFTEQGRIPEAIEELERASEFTDDDKFALASLTRSRAKLSVALGTAEAAIRDFRRALELHQAHGAPADVAQITVEFASFLFKEGNRRELERLAAGVSIYFAAAECDQNVREPIENLVALVVMKNLDFKSLANVREELVNVNQRSKSSPAQPPGGYWPPISGSSPVSKLLFGGKISLAEASSSASAPKSETT